MTCKHRIKREGLITYICIFWGERNVQLIRPGGGGGGTGEQANSIPCCIIIEITSLLKTTCWKFFSFIWLNRCVLSRFLWPTGVDLAK